MQPTIEYVASFDTKEVSEQALAADYDPAPLDDLVAQAERCEALAVERVVAAKERQNARSRADEGAHR